MPLQRTTRLACGAAVIGAIAALLAPVVAAPSKKPVSPEAAAFSTECSACHMPFPARFLPKRSWAAVMGGLDNHFGETASVDAEVNAKILAYLSANAADNRGGEKVLGLSPDKTPLRLTETPVWRSSHRGLIARGVFKRAEIKSEANCTACHRDAAQGRFGD
jgi:Dihaem cytochrome c